MKLAKPGILYVAGVEKLRSPTIVRRWSYLPPRPSRNRVRAATWLDSANAPGFAGGLTASEPAAAIPRRRFVCLCTRQPPKEIVVDRVARGEAVGDLPQKLPSTAIYCHFGAAKSLGPIQPFRPLLGLDGVPGRRTETDIPVCSQNSSALSIFGRNVQNDPSRGLARDDNVGAGQAQD